MMPVSLFQELKLGGFHSSISTTYSVDPAFYDSTVQYKLRVYGCRNNILLADQGMLTRALTSTPEAFQKAGLEYVVKGFSHSRSFHPKIMARYGKSKARLVIGSANATCAGWGRNLEALSVVSWKLNSDSQDNLVYGNLVHKTHNYLMGLLEKDENQNVAYKRRLLQKEAPWLAKFDLGFNGSELEDGTLVDVLFGFPGQPVSLFTQFASKITDKPTSISIVSPYWDSDLSTLLNLRKKFGDIPTKIWVNMQTPEMSRSQFPIKCLIENEEIQFFQTSNAVAGRFPHAKIICLHTDKHDHILFGSANCTFAALGSETRPGLNDEACVYRRVPKNTLAEHLNLNQDTPIDADTLGSPDEVEEEAPAETKFEPGSLQLFGRKIVWTPHTEIPIHGAKIIIQGQSYQIHSVSKTQGSVLLNSETINVTIVAIIELEDGRRSRPVIIEAPEVLKSAAPSSIQKGLQDKLNSVIAGDSDLMNLARDFHLIFTQDADPSSAALSSSSKGRSVSTDRMGIDYDTPEAFREALSVSNKMNRQDLSHADSPAMQAILKIVLRGLINFTDHEDQEAIRKAEAAALDSGEFNDGADHKDSDDYNDLDVQTVRDISEHREWSECISLAQFEKNQFYLLKVIGELEVQIRALAKSPKKIDPEFVTQILFVFYLMMYGCTHEYDIEKGEKRTLIAFGFSDTKDRSKVFLNRAVLMIKNLWGDSWHKNLFRHMGVKENSENLPIPLYTLIVLSRWIMAAICVEVSDKKEYESLKSILDRQIPKIFKSTFCFPIDDKEMVEIVTEIQSRVVSDKLFGGKVLLELEKMTKEIAPPSC